MAIYYGKEGELTGPDRETQEISMLALHLLQSALVLVNTRLIDRSRSEPAWAAKMTERDLRGLTPMFWGNVLLYLDNYDLEYGQPRVRITRRSRLRGASSRSWPSRARLGRARLG